jgi:FixJ family two-component response regulator
MPALDTTTAPTMAPTSAPRRDGAPGACICVVDDDAGVRRALANLFDAGGYRCLGFDSGEALLAWPDLGAIDVAIFDVKLRGMDGFALQRRCAERGLQAPLLFFSGHGDAGMERRALRAGALALLRKPVDPDLLLEQIERALERASELRGPSR